MPLRVQGRRLRGHIPREWLLFFGEPSYTFLPVHGLGRLWSYVMHLIHCQQCGQRIVWPRPFRNAVAAAGVPAAPPPSPVRTRRRYTRRVWGPKSWRRNRGWFYRATGERSGRLSRVVRELEEDHVVGEQLESATIADVNSNNPSLADVNNWIGYPDGMIGNGNGE